MKKKFQIINKASDYIAAVQLRVQGTVYFWLHVLMDRSGTMNNMSANSMDRGSGELEKPNSKRRH